MKLLVSILAGLGAAFLTAHLTNGWAFSVANFIVSWVMLAFFVTAILTYRVVK